MSNISDQLTRDEGEVLHAYKDSRGYLTIGIGRLIDQRKGGGITHAEAMMLLENDIRAKTEELTDALPWVVTLDDARHGVLVNMSFNMGVHGLLTFKNTLAHVRAGDYPAAAEGMLQSLWARQVKGRATRLARQMAEGVWR